MTRRCVWMSVVLVFVLASVGWSAPQEAATATQTTTQGSRLITVSGALTDAGGQPRAGSLGLTFKLYAGPAGGEALWGERQVVVADAAGRYSVLLGATVPGGVSPEVFGEGKAQWLGVQVEAEAELPRVLLVAVPYALRAADADTLGGKPLTSFVTSEELTKVVDERVASTTAAKPCGRRARRCRWTRWGGTRCCWDRPPRRGCQRRHSATGRRSGWRCRWTGRRSSRGCCW